MTKKCRIVDGAHDEVVVLLRENRARLDSLAKALLEHETLDEDDAYAAAGVEHAAGGNQREDRGELGDE
jgi:cell division protease FtsH